MTFNLFPPVLSWTKYEPSRTRTHLDGSPLFCILLCGTDVPFMDNARAIKSTMKEITWRFKIFWEKHFQDFDSSQLHAEPRLLKVLNGFPSIGAMRKGWRLARNDILPAAFRMLCNINDEYVSSGKHPLNIYVTFEDVVLRIANWRNNPFFHPPSEALLQDCCPVGSCAQAAFYFRARY